MNENWMTYGVAQCPRCSGPIDTTTSRHIDPDGDLMDYRETMVWCHEVKRPEPHRPPRPVITAEVVAADPRHAAFHQAEEAA